jgi:hypothetical protein
LALLLIVLLIVLQNVLFIGTVALSASEAEPSATSVGIPRQINQLVIPGPLVRPRPWVRGQPVVVRIVAEYPHGDAHRYDFEYTLLEAGRFDLRDYLQREDSSPMDGVPPLPVEATTVLPAGQILPNDVPPGPLPGWGGYRAVMITGGVLWGCVLLYLLVPRRKRTVVDELQAATKSLETRLHEAIQAAEAGTLSPAERAELERMVLAHWRQRLGLTHLPAAEALSAVRQHEQARNALNLLEQWLHHPQERTIEDFAALWESGKEDGRGPRA